MPEKWTGKLVGKMHNARVTGKELAEELGVSRPYVCQVLNGAKNRKNAEADFNAAFEAILQKRKS